MNLAQLADQYWKQYALVNEMMRKWNVFERPQKKSYLKAKAKEDKLRSQYYNAIRKGFLAKVQNRDE